MPIIKEAKLKHAELLSKISKTTFLTSHGDSAPKEDIDIYLEQNFSEQNFIDELSNKTNQYYLIYVEQKIAGYSKIIFNKPQSTITSKNVTYLSRLYLLKDFYGLGLGKILFDFNRNLCKQNNQVGIWLYVWIQNVKAISFYKKMGFQKIGNADFKISETHSNPNHILYLKF